MTDAVAAPTVVGPITGTQPPCGAPRTDLAARGYVVEEFFLEGTLRGHQLRPGTEATVDGRWEVEPYGDAPYRTRLLVLRPERSGRFNGTVVVNWQNVSAGYETSAPSDGEVYDGYAWVGVSAQEIGLYGSPLGRERFRSRRSLPLLEHDPDR